ncbi:C-C chemokine receptor type 5 [Toxotes jaculatrix]|uniref:C-C chemokine receptor type 5 n=1 Tax=Toxotes jaculatrix TaxID=941984 RepID=UPI001B3A840A|nr:C-C chemokine receptor type 5 [Toxotes jaculatrix]
MSDNGTNSTVTTMSTMSTIYDYSSYYYDENISSFAPCSHSELKQFGQVFLPIFYSLVFIVGFAGNGLVVCVLVKHRKQTNLTDICLFNLAVSDLLFVVTLPFYAHYAVVSQWTFGGFMCRFISVCHSIGFFSSIFSMVVMTVDRYMVILHTHGVAGYRTVRAGVFVSMTVWMLSLFVSLPSAIYTEVINDHDGPSCNPASDDKAWKLYNILVTNILGLVLPFLVMVVCYSRIIPRLASIRSPKRHRIVRLIISIMIVFFLFWAPFNISMFLTFLQLKRILPNACEFDNNLRMSLTVTETLAYTHCCLNPIIYAFVGQKFMKRAEHLLRQWIPASKFLPIRDFSDSLFRRSSVMSRSSDGTSTFAM